MPRIPYSLIRRAHRENPLLPLLLRECRTVDSARNELRWLYEAVREKPSPTKWSWLISMCRLRSRGFPLQYILGNQPFGELEILCHRGVLIPRPETESYTYKSAQILRQRNEGKSERKLRVLDLCTGTGCISLLLHTLLAPHFQRLSITGVDISPVALGLAQKNIQHNVQLGHLAPHASTDIQFHRADVLGSGSDSLTSIQSLLQSLDRCTSPPSASVQYDLLISNPPYISRAEFRNGTTARSVRLFEPELALVPPTVTETGTPEDIFYRRILSLALELETPLAVLECGDMAQAQRVVALYERLGSNSHSSAEIWPTSERDLAEYGFHETDGSRCVIIQRLLP
ncbi:unnamed protein product [Penicillium olsonii]|uniref:Methyltransferase domain-containing protein n=1 Tax=Penicillium olsonii TaxID=99116 RepID=A0A9W4MUS6_PENOL|nr:unnamed protein product [Penicillium olsonii]